MAFVKRAHGGHEAENAIVQAIFMRDLLHPFDGMDGLHVSKRTRELE
jgi:hypothetical protein